MAVTLGTNAQGLGKVQTAGVFANGFRKCVTGSVDAAGDISDIWDKNQGGLTDVEVILFDGAGIPDYGAQTVAGGAYPQRFIAFGR